MPLGWIDFQDDDHEESKAILLWLLSLSQIDREIVIGRIRALRELAAGGDIEDGDEEKLKPLRRDPDLWELRWNEFGKLLRQYHAEPPVLPNNLVNLHMHVKWLSPSDDSLTDDLQEQQINYAFMRYRAGEKSLWKK